MLTKTIALEGIEIMAPVGYYKEERENKNTFIIDISIDETFKENQDTDDIYNTLNYEKLFNIVEEEMAIECKLMENAASRIHQRIMALDENLLAIKITIRKKDPPLKGNVKFSKVELHWNRE
jgi:dihydroneopterin aldolase